VDVLTPEQRSKCMAAIKGKDTRPEIAVRSILDAMRVRYEVHKSDLPGKPDIVLSRRKKVIFVHGCFWHVHRCRYGRVKPAKNWRFWRDKRNETRKRDKKNRRALREAGWEVFTVWECWTKYPKQLIARLTKFLASHKAGA
jgi:DNA mismatch endonuclease (patch repair protein)